MDDLNQILMALKARHPDPADQLAVMPNYGSPEGYFPQMEPTSGPKFDPLTYWFDPVFRHGMNTRGERRSSAYDLLPYQGESPELPYGLRKDRISMTNSVVGKDNK